MPLTAISIQGYRSIQRLYFDVDACSIFVGANGVGKTNLYKALGLLRAAADGNLTRAIAQEGGIESVLWAGVRKGGGPRQGNDKPGGVFVYAIIPSGSWDLGALPPPAPPGRRRLVRASAQPQGAADRRRVVARCPRRVWFGRAGPRSGCENVAVSEAHPIDRDTGLHVRAQQCSRGRVVVAAQLRSAIEGDEPRASLR